MAKIKPDDLIWRLAFIDMFDICFVAIEPFVAEM